MKDVTGVIPTLDMSTQHALLEWDAATGAQSRPDLNGALPVRIAERACDALTFGLLMSEILHVMTHSDLAIGSWIYISSVRTQTTTLGLVLATAIAFILWLDTCGIYNLSGGLLRVRETACLLRAVFIPAAVLEFLLPFIGGARYMLPMAGFAVILFSLLFLQKFIFRTVLSHLRRLPGFEHRVLVYGKPELMKKLDGALRRSPKLGMRAVALISSRPEGEVESGSVLPLSASMIRAYNADSLVIAHSHLDEATLQQLREVAVDAGAAIFFMAAVPGTGQNELDQIELDGQLLYGAHEPRFARLHGATSRALDIAVSLTTLAVFSVPMAALALVVRFTSEGPILFRQVRIGKDGRPFTMMKFRSMYTDMCGDAVSPTKGNDPRITPIGRLLRKSSLDELPQLFNVLRGEMALVGPRPEMPFIVEKYRQIHRQRLSVKPGLTGIWQISEHRKAPIHDNIEYDLYYVKHRSFSVDIAVILHTLVFAVKGV